MFTSRSLSPLFSGVILVFSDSCNFESWKQFSSVDLTDGRLSASDQMTVSSSSSSSSSSHSSPWTRLTGGKLVTLYKTLLLLLLFGFSFPFYANNAIMKCAILFSYDRQFQYVALNLSIGIRLTIDHYSINYSKKCNILINIRSISDAYSRFQIVDH